MLQNNVKMLQIIVAKYCNTVAKCCKKVAKCCKMLQKCFKMLQNVAKTLQTCCKMLQNVAKCCTNVANYWVLKRFDYPKLPKLQCFDVALRGAKKLEEPKSLTYGATRLPRAPIKCIAPIYDVAKLRCCEVANLELLPLSFTSRL